MAKRNKIQSTKIVNELTELIINGYSRKQIVQYCAETHNIAERQVDNYLSQVYNNISNDLGKYRKSLIKQSIKRFNDLYDRNSAIQDYRECRQVQESIIKLFGLNEPIKSDITSGGEKIETSTMANIPTELLVQLADHLKK